MFFFFCRLLFRFRGQWEFDLVFQVNMIKDDGTVIHFNNPKVQASLSANTFAITGHAETKQLTEMLPGILSQLGADSLTSLRKLAEQFPRQGELHAFEIHGNQPTQSQQFSKANSYYSCINSYILVRFVHHPIRGRVRGGIWGHVCL